MSEFDLPKDWKIRIAKGSKYHNSDHITLENMTRPEVFRWLKEQGLVDYKFVEE